MAKPATPGTLGDGIAPAPLIRLPPIGFWSYSRQDDELSKARLSNLRSLLMAEIQQQYGRDRVLLFQDVSAIPHGAEWEREIRNSLGNSTFFIPIVTPNFLQSEWCCREVMVFLEREEQLFEVYPDLPQRRRIFPLQLIDIEGIEPADGRVLEALEKLQWFDFRDLRHSSYDHESVHRALSKFAASIRDLLQVKVRPPRTAEEIEREAAAAAARAREEEAAIALRLAQEEEHRRREAEEGQAEARRSEAARAAEALRAAETEARAEAERQAQAARIEANRAAETPQSANADADSAEWGAEEEFAGAPGEGGLLRRWRAVPLAHRIALGTIMILILGVGIVVLLSRGGGEKIQTAAGASNVAASTAPVERAVPSSLPAPLPGRSGAASTPAESQRPDPVRLAGEAQAPANVADRQPIARSVAGVAIPARLVSGGVSSDDYPAAALRAESEGTTGVRYTVGPSGRVTSCSVVSSSGDAALDAATCRIIRLRFRFAPARDSQGHPTSETGGTRIRWTFPAE